MSILLSDGTLTPHSDPKHADLIEEDMVAIKSSSAKAAKLMPDLARILGFLANESLNGAYRTMYTNFKE